MALLDQRDIDDARSRDIANLAESFGVEFTGRRGKWWPARCPFPDHDDGSPSFYACPSAGKFKCHGCGRHGDTIELTIQMHPGLHFGEAVDQLNGKVKATFTAPAKRELVAVKDEADEWERVDPANAIKPEKPWRQCRGLTHTDRHEFRDANGVLLAFVDRFKGADVIGDDGKVIKPGKKTLRPFTCWSNKETGVIEWLPRGFADDQPRPLYRLDKLHANPEAKVLLVEGERKADVAQQRLADAGIPISRLVVVGWHGGSEVADKIDLEPLCGRAVRLWPDADQHAYKAPHPRAGEVMPMIEQPGHRAMLQIFSRLDGTASNVLLITPPSNVPDGWDLGDQFPEGFNLRGHLEDKGNIMGSDALKQVVADLSAAQEPATPSPTKSDNRQAVDHIADAMKDLGRLQQKAAKDGDVRPNFKGFEHAGDLETDETPTDWLIYGVLERGVTAVIYGDSNVGKSFIAIDMMCRLTTGMSWCGRPEGKKCVVFYLCGEGRKGIGRRLRAWARKNDTTLVGLPVFVSKSRAMLDNKEAALEVAKCIRAMIEEHGNPDLIVVDTLAKNFGGEENSAKEMGAFINNIEHELRDPWNASILIVHHSGKKDKDSARGSSSLKCGIDVEFKAEKGEDGILRLDMSKSRDSKYAPVECFELEEVGLGYLDHLGAEETSAVAVSKARTEKPQKGKQGRGGKQMQALQILREMEEGQRDTVERDGRPRYDANVREADWRDVLISKGLASGKHWGRFRESLVAARVIAIDVGGFVRSCGEFDEGGMF